jgi:hypothetical protein
LLAGLVGLLVFTLVLAVAARAEASAARPPASTAPKDAVLSPAKAVAPADPADLGRGLRYLQLAAGTSDSAFAAALAAPALVLDLRVASNEPAVEERLTELLAHATAARPLFILLGRATPETLRIAIPAAAPGLLTLAAKDNGIAAGVLIPPSIPRETAPPPSARTGKPPRNFVEEADRKGRFDEARLAATTPTVIASAKKPTDPRDHPAAKRRRTQHRSSRRCRICFSSAPSSSTAVCLPRPYSEPPDHARPRPRHRRLHSQYLPQPHGREAPRQPSPPSPSRCAR